MQAYHDIEYMHYSSPCRSSQIYPKCLLIAIKLLALTVLILDNQLHACNLIAAENNPFAVLVRVIDITTQMLAEHIQMLDDKVCGCQLYLHEYTTA